MKLFKLAILMLLPISALAATVDYTYTPPSEREDNTELLQSEIMTYEVYDNEVELRDFTTYPLPNNATGFTLELAPGLHNINLKTVDTENRKSNFSVTVTTDVPYANPKPVTGLTETAVTY